MPHITLFYSFRGTEKKCSEWARDKEEGLAQFKKKYPWITPVRVEVTHENIHSIPGRTFAALRELDITWNTEMANFIKMLALSSSTRLFLETTENRSGDVENHYYDITGSVIVFGQTEGYAISPDDNKWSTKGSIFFDQNINIPLSLELHRDTSGAVNSVELFWALIRIGFRLGSEQDSAKILNSIPQIKESVIV